MGLVTRSGWMVLVASCSFSASGNMQKQDGGHAPADMPLDTFLPDPTTCTAADRPACIGGYLRTCPIGGTITVDTNCTWGCVSGSTAHCGEVVPSGNAITSTDFDDNPALHVVTLSGATTINTDTGEITSSGFTRPPGASPAIQNGVNYQAGRGGGTIGFFGFAALTIDGPVTVVGRRALALAATMSITVHGSISVQGSCTSTSAGPGGYLGGHANLAATGDGGGAAGGAGDLDSGGGGGGGYAGTGGTGGGSSTPPLDAGVPDAAPKMPVLAAGGTPFGTPAIAILEGGGGGGGGGGSGAGDGGGGGGAVELAAYQVVEIAAGARIDATGCAGGAGTTPYTGGGGGGGAGGTILVEAAIVRVSGHVISNGGHGGIGGGGTTGGTGGAGLTTNGDPGTTDPVNSGGGGGGSVGRLRFSTAGGVITLVGEDLSPPIGSTGASLGSASVH